MITYEPLFNKLEKKKMRPHDLMVLAGVAPNTMTKIRNGKNVSLEVLERFCRVLECDFKDIVGHVEEKKE